MRTLKDMRREASNWQIQHGVAVYIMEACANWVEFRRRNPNVPIVLIDILHDAQRYLVHWSVLSLAKELLPRISDGRFDGPVERLRSNFISGIKRLPIALTPA